MPGSNVLHEKNGRRAILWTQQNALLDDQKSRAGVCLCFGSLHPFGKEFSWKKTDTLTTRTGRGIGRRSGGARSVCLARRTRPPETPPAKPDSPPTEAYRLAVAAAGRIGSLSQYLVLEGVRFRPRPTGDRPGALRASGMGTASMRAWDTRPEAAENCGKATASCGSAKGVVGICQASRRGPVALVTRCLTGALGTDTNEDHLTGAEMDRVWQAPKNPRHPRESPWRERVVGQSRFCPWVQGGCDRNSWIVARGRSMWSGWIPFAARLLSF
ncbi:hypothetical protein [Candidatus Methylacidithermus pantelleriae]|uniref:Uncharacterized protein n=1 Tax=Candidatus Methylacidithermus pantelleriae TaxID=2744239 RepID=A0A8J2BG79_9BACT|nr:hypothetical protein [Candidatus Methylacidithermus pantelleriae]CAF0689855.1 hypothetical protein MPNT_10401 [Candidatus Methylacidithermus pantelleriae]